MISSRSVTDGVSLSVSKSKLVYNSLIFVLDNILTLIRLLTQQRLLTVSLRNTQIIQLIFEDKRAMRIGRLTQSPFCL